MHTINGTPLPKQVIVHRPTIDPRLLPLVLGPPSLPLYLAQQPRTVHLVVFRGELLHRDVVGEVVPEVALALALLPLAGLSILPPASS